MLPDQRALALCQTPPHEWSVKKPSHVIPLFHPYSPVPSLTGHPTPTGNTKPPSHRPPPFFPSTINRQNKRPLPSPLRHRRLRVMVHDLGVRPIRLVDDDARRTRATAPAGSPGRLAVGRQGVLDQRRGVVRDGDALVVPEVVRVGPPQPGRGWDGGGLGADGGGADPAERVCWREVGEGEL